MPEPSNAEVERLESDVEALVAELRRLRYQLETGSRLVRTLFRRLLHSDVALSATEILAITEFTDQVDGQVTDDVRLQIARLDVAHLERLLQARIYGPCASVGGASS